MILLIVIPFALVAGMAVMVISFLLDPFWTQHDN